jgi:hypothetical protein
MKKLLLFVFFFLFLSFFFFFFSKSNNSITSMETMYFFFLSTLHRWFHSLAFSSQITCVCVLMYVDETCWMVRYCGDLHLWMFDNSESCRGPWVLPQNWYSSHCDQSMKVSMYFNNRVHIPCSSFEEINKMMHIYILRVCLCCALELEDDDEAAKVIERETTSIETRLGEMKEVSKHITY